MIEFLPPCNQINANGMNTHDNSRRKFLRNSLLATGGVILAPNFISCKNDDDLNIIPISDFDSKNFEQGVASFDPTSSQVIIWTRYSGGNGATQIQWELATTEDFSSIIRSGIVTTDASRDYTIAIEIQELDADQKLYYRFSSEANQSVSPVGQTITLPENADEIKLAVCSCSNYQAGLFNVYNAMAKSDADVIVHLGDYIYEYAAGGYGATPENASLGRNHLPDLELLSLDDYRTRYKQYREDADLQLAHQLKPFICVWDDHEITNDAYINGAENHNEGEGDYETRKEFALQAYSEYLPVTTTVSGVDNSIIYRNLNLGNLVNLIMLDTRIIGRDQQLDTSVLFTNPNAIADPSRSLLGTTQLGWLQGKLAASNTKWQVLGQQVLMGKMFVPAEMLTSFGTPQFNQILTELVTIKARSLAGDPTLTTQELARIETTAPYNLDAWDGYFAEREVLYGSLGGKKIVTLAGDTHNAWHNILTDINGTEVGVELATPGVSSPGFEAFIGTDPAAVAGFEQALVTLIDDLQYFDASRRGFLMTTFTNSHVTGEWHYVDTLLLENYSLTVGNTTTYNA